MSLNPQLRSQSPQPIITSGLGQFLIHAQRTLYSFLISVVITVFCNLLVFFFFFNLLLGYTSEDFVYFACANTHQLAHFWVPSNGLVNAHWMHEPVLVSGSTLYFPNCSFLKGILTLDSAEIWLFTSGFFLQLWYTLHEPFFQQFQNSSKPRIEKDNISNLKTMV